MGTYDDPGSEVPIAKWATDGKALKADPSSFSGYGKNVATIGQNLQSDAMSVSTAMAGGERDLSWSTGGFEPGTTAQRLATRNAQDISYSIADLTVNIIAISSVALIMGDLFQSMEDENTAKVNSVMVNAVDWAFVLPGAHRPADLPFYIDPKRTVESLTDPAKDKKPQSTEGDTLIGTYSFSGGTTQTYRTADSGTRTIVNTAQGTTEFLTDKNGNTVYEITTAPSGTTVAKSYSKGKVVSETIERTRTVKSGKTTDEQTIVTQNTGQKEVTKHIVTTNEGDGTHTRDYYDTEPGGKKTDERHIGPQGDPVTGDDWSDLAKRRIKDAHDAMYGM